MTPATQSTCSGSPVARANSAVLLTEGAAVSDRIAACSELPAGLVGWRAAAGSPPATPNPARCCSRPRMRYAEAIRLGIDVDLTVSGPTIRARVTQLFRNPTKDWVEAVYVYPLPAGGAVDTLKMVVGDRVVVGEIKERQQARIIYEQAKRERPEGGADRTGAAEHLHQLGRQYRPRRNRAGADRISGAGAPDRQRRSRCACRWWSAPRYNPAPIVQSVDFKPRRRRLGRERDRSGAGPRPHLAAGARPARATRRSIRPRSRCACRPAFRSAR